MEDLIFFSKASLPRFEEYINEIRECWDTHWITSMGPKHQLLEKQLEDFLSVKNVMLFSNGHSALEMLLQAMDLHGEVITTPFTFASTTHAIVRNGLKPRFCDIKESDYTLDETKLESLINENTSAIVPVHVFGNICNVEQIQKVAQKYNLKVIYDAAHAFGVKVHGESVANISGASMFSFHASKVFNTIEGGAAIVNDEVVKSRLEKIRVFGVGKDEFVELVGANGKMNEFQAAMGICNLRHFREDVAKRKIADAYYRERLEKIKGIRTNKIPEGVESNYAYFPILIDASQFGHSRDELCRFLHDNNILARKHFYQLANTYPCYSVDFNKDSTPVAEYVAEHLLSLPLYSDITKEEIDRICDAVNNFAIR